MYELLVYTHKHPLYMYDLFIFSDSIPLFRTFHYFSLPSFKINGMLGRQNKPLYLSFILFIYFTLTQECHHTICIKGNDNKLLLLFYFFFVTELPLYKYKCNTGAIISYGLHLFYLFLHLNFFIKEN